MCWNTDNIVQKTSESITSMNLSDEAAKSANETMDAYIKAMKKKTGEVGSAVKGVNDELGKIGINVTTEDKTDGKGEAHATGGIFDEPHWGVFAEAGPEAFIPIDGSQNAINIWKDTGKLLGQLEDSPNNKVVGPSIESHSTESKSSNDKTITIKLEGGGELKVSGSNKLSKEQVLSILQENIKPTLLKIISQEIFEEGEGAYEY